MWFLALFFSLAFDLSGVYARVADDNLTQNFAQDRREQIAYVSYDLYFELMKGASEFKGKSSIVVALKDLKKDLNIDLYEQKISEVLVNGEVNTKYKLQKGSLTIPAQFLKAETIIQITYTGKFSTEASGFQRSVDPIDQAEYLFTDFEPYYAHWFFPCFDQPNLKASYVVTVKAPKEWKVIANERIKKVTAEGDKNITLFEATQPISPYLFFLGAGPFHEWKDQTTSTPIHLYARKSLARYVDSARIMQTTKAGLKFYSEYFAHPYPFSKYAQLFIPEFSWGGMENPGAITLNERNIFRGEPTLSQLSDRDDLILHEMAHMWFGDLVTMNWWDDLWLNESFATYLASMAHDRALNSKETWMDFFNTKGWGYWQDQLVTTHPIETKVSDTRETKGNFDGITYAKGASVLKQLHYFVGEEGFKTGLQHYFKKYAFKNTTRKDFIHEIAEASGKKLDAWTKAWLQTAGPHRVQVKFSCDSGVIKDFKLTQKANVSKIYSPHKTQMGLFKYAQGKFKLYSSLDVFYDSEELQVKKFIGHPCPDFVYPNVDDQDYALISLDEKSLKLAPQALTEMPDSLMRLMLWQTLHQMVRESKLAAYDFFKMAVPALKQENDQMLLGLLLGRHGTLKEDWNQFLTLKERSELAPELEQLLMEKLKTKNLSLRLVYFDFMVAIAQTPQTLDLFAKALKAQNVFPLKIDQDRRWSLIGVLARAGHNDAPLFIEQEEKLDPTTQGKRNSYALKIAQPLEEGKKNFFDVFKDPSKVTYTNLEVAARNFHLPNNPELSKQFIKPYFEKVKKLDWKDQDTYVEIYFTSLFPRYSCDQETLKLSEKSFDGASELSNLARRSWLEANDELKRCISVRTLSKSFLK